MALEVQVLLEEVRFDIEKISNRVDPVWRGVPMKKKDYGWVTILVKVRKGLVKIFGRSYLDYPSLTRLPEVANSSKAEVGLS